MSNFYEHRDTSNLDKYPEHVNAMTKESLHSKSDIAAELAYRDGLIQKQQEEIERLKSNEIIDGMKAECFGEIIELIYSICPCQIDDVEGSCEDCNDEGVYLSKNVISWTTMRGIYELMHKSKVRLLSNE